MKYKEQAVAITTAEEFAAAHAAGARVEYTCDVFGRASVEDGPDDRCGGWIIPYHDHFTPKPDMYRAFYPEA